MVIFNSYMLNWVLFKVIFYFPNRKSTIWGIYSEDFFIFWNPLKQIQVNYIKLPYKVVPQSDS